MLGSLFFFKSLCFCDSKSLAFIGELFLSIKALPKPNNHKLPFCFNYNKLKFSMFWYCRNITSLYIERERERELNANFVCPVLIHFYHYAHIIDCSIVSFLFFTLLQVQLANISDYREHFIYMAMHIRHELLSYITYLIAFWHLCTFLFPLACYWFLIDITP